MSVISSSIDDLSCDITLNEEETQSTTNINEEVSKKDSAEEALDPRIQIELERLNKACGQINSLKNELEETKTLFTNSNSTQLQRLENMQRIMSSSITKAKPYYDALSTYQRLQHERQSLYRDYQKASSFFNTAKETLSVAEINMSPKQITAEWQEHLSETIAKLNSSKRTVDIAHEMYRSKENQALIAEHNLQSLEKDLKKHILKSQPYYQEKSRWNIQLEAQSIRLNELERLIAYSKSIYNEAMSNLSKISEDIHNKRRYGKNLTKLIESCVDNDD